ncbi:MAG: hypothetical protein EAZ87_06190 [Nostocales cyanobacterium]|nr:MAG: hypothetical protein EAZ87_06190 [Nostocales cyanobacterium]
MKLWHDNKLIYYLLTHGQSHIIMTIKIAIQSNHINHFTETLVYLLSLVEEFKITLITQTDTNLLNLDTEHPWCLERLNKNQKVEIISLDTEAQNSDYLFITLSNHNFIEHKRIIKWVSGSKKIGLLSNSNYSSWKYTLKELIFNFPYWIFAKSLILQVHNNKLNPHFLIINKFFYTPSVHPQNFSSEQLRKKMFSFSKPNKFKRQFKFTFIGNKNPTERTIVLQQVRETIATFQDLNEFNEYPVKNKLHSTAEITSILWIEYGDDKGEGSRGLSPNDYIDALSESDFCISPLGWGGNWTHRTVEALARGAIPILEDASRYNIGLEDMISCILVKDNNWHEAIIRANNLDENQIYKMRCQIQKICKDHLLPEASAINLTQNLGL